jgi:geranylgeranyl pyrophosphate synthase
MSKIVEITYITQQIHKRIIDIRETQSPDSTLSKAEHRKLVENLHKANKAATLIGDLLWTQKCVHMAALKCQPVTGLICGFLMDYCESEFIFGVNTVRSDAFSYRSWVQKTQLGIGSLMGSTMSAMLLFSGHDDPMRNIGFKLGSLLGLTYQVQIRFGSTSLHSSIISITRFRFTFTGIR